MISSVALAFISHVSADTELAHSIASGLGTRGILCWMASRDLPSGSAPYGATVLSALRECDACVLIVSRASARSPHVLRETERAGHYRKRIISLIVDDVELDRTLKFLIADEPRVSYSSDSAGRVLETLAAIISAEEGRQREPQPQPKPGLGTTPPGFGPGLEPSPNAVPTQSAAVGRDSFSQEAQQADSRQRIVFVCYRREDTEDAAGRLHDKLLDAYGSDRVFMDVDSVPLGIDFVEHVAEQVTKCSAVIVMIGREWLTIQDRRGRRRLDLDNDLVRAEIAAALQQKIPVIPVLVQNADMPYPEDLPDDIRLLTRRNGIDMSGGSWRTGLERLIKELDRVMKPSGAL